MLTAMDGLAKVCDYEQSSNDLFVDLRKRNTPCPKTRKLQPHATETLLCLVRNFVTDNSFVIRMFGAISEHFPTSLGVPRCSALGTLLFLVCINDPHPFLNRGARARRNLFGYRQNFPPTGYE